MKSESIFHLVILGDKVINVEQIKIGQRLRDISFANGAILVSTDKGALLKIAPSEVLVSIGAFPEVYPDNSFYTQVYLFKNLGSLVDKLLDRIAGFV